MISEGSCDTEDWSNDAENSALITEINYNYIFVLNRYWLSAVPLSRTQQHCPNANSIMQ